MFDFEKAIAIAQEQEDVLQFDHFDAKDAWKLGCILVDLLEEKKVDISICIRRFNGKVLFQYATDGTNIVNETWMKRKFNTSAHFESSSIKAAMILQSRDLTFDAQGLNPADFVGCGGGFPLRVKGTGIAGILTVSGLPHEQDHAFMIEGISRYLGVEAPALDMIVPMMAP